MNPFFFASYRWEIQHFAYRKFNTGIYNNCQFIITENLASWGINEHWWKENLAKLKWTLTLFINKSTLLNPLSNQSLAWFSKSQPSVRIITCGGKMVCAFTAAGVIIKFVQIFYKCKFAWVSLPNCFKFAKVFSPPPSFTLQYIFG